MLTLKFCFLSCIFYNWLETFSLFNSNEFRSHQCIILCHLLQEGLEETLFFFQGIFSLAGGWHWHPGRPSLIGTISVRVLLHYLLWSYWHRQRIQLRIQRWWGRKREADTWRSAALHWVLMWPGEFGRGSELPPPTALKHFLKGVDFERLGANPKMCNASFFLPLSSCKRKWVLPC